MGILEDITSVGRMLDAYAATEPLQHVAAADPQDAGVPPDMQAEPVNAEDWVTWKMLPSTLSEGDVRSVEDEFGVRLPPLFRAYLLARFHLFDQVHSRRYNQLILMSDIPSGRKLRPLRELMRSWAPLIGAEFVPFAQWGDGWGPMCFDTHQRDAGGECPVVWMDHERLIPLGPQACARRERILPWVQPLYSSCGEFLADVFVSG
jgi:hypothetical protein